MHLSFNRWLKLSYLNLLIVALAGVVLRYKIAFALPFIDQKNLLHGHSHFAFAGWLTQVLIVLMVQYLVKYKGEIIFRKYRLVLCGNFVTAYGMLIFFILQGYSTWAIIFSTASILISFLFAFQFWKDLNIVPSKNNSRYWFKAALLFNVVSSLWLFYLAYMMVTKTVVQSWYLAAVYYFLHFQYNGWFFFAIVGLLYAMLESHHVLLKHGKFIFWLFCISCMPAFFLSVLWVPATVIIYWLVVASAIAQLGSWLLLISQLLKNSSGIKSSFPLNSRRLLLLSAAALTIKLLLQLGSTHPALSHLAFGFRPIVIGYLHLVLLGVISIFILGYTFSVNQPGKSRYWMGGAWIFITGIIINEILLMAQGVTGLKYIIIPYINWMLFSAAIIMFTGVLVINLHNLKYKGNTT